MVSTVHARRVRAMVDWSAQPVRPKARCTAGSVRIVTLLWAMVLAPQRIPTSASRILSTGRSRTVFCGIVTCSRSGAKKHRRRRYSPRAQRLARPVWRMVDFDMAHSFQEGDIVYRYTFDREYTPYKSAL